MLKCEIIGNIGADCEIKNDGGNKFATMRVAHSVKYKDHDQKEHEETIWVDVVISNVENKVIPYLKQGVKVYVRGNARLRVYSSPKLRMMVAGLTINASDIEICGGTTDDVPRQLIIPETGVIVDVAKCYSANVDTTKFKKEDVATLIDRRGNRYLVNKDKWVIPAPDDAPESPEHVDDK